MFESGEKVVFFNEMSEMVLTGQVRPYFTIGKVYAVEPIPYIGSQQEYILWIMDDHGSKRGYNINGFISLKEYRKRKLLKCLK